MNNRKLFEFGHTTTVEQRVAKCNFATESTKLAAKVEGGDRESTFPINTSRFIGNDRYHVYIRSAELLSGWEKQGFVETKSKRIKVCNPSRADESSVRGWIKFQYQFLMRTKDLGKERFRRRGCKGQRRRP